MEHDRQARRRAEEIRKTNAHPVSPGVEVVEIPDDHRGHMDFLHPWGDKWLNPLVLLITFMGLTAGRIMALRSQDIG